MIERDFSQYGEQPIILDFFSRETRPYSRYCVDAGAFDGEVGSNSRALFLSGWAGLAIEPNPRSFDRLSRLYTQRSDIKCLRTALSDEKRKALMKFSIGPDGTPNDERWQYGQVSTLVDAFAEAYETDHAYRYESAEIETDTLTNILKEYAVPANFGFLTIDCEGEDPKVIGSLDLKFYRPLLICLEADDDWQSQYARMLAPFGYRSFTRTASNVFFAR